MNGWEMTTLYGLKTCDTCRKALKSIDNVEFVDVRSDGVPDAVLAHALETFEDALLNKKSTTWRNLSDEQKTLPILTLLKAHPTVMKRPLFARCGALYLGWGKEVQATLTS